MFELEEQVHPEDIILYLILNAEKDAVTPHKKAHHFGTTFALI
jgi:hypothetical protein